MEAEANLDCRNASRVLSLSYERPLSAAELRALQRHLARCLMCENFESQLRFLHQAARRFRDGE